MLRKLKSLGYSANLHMHSGSCQLLQALLFGSHKVEQKQATQAQPASDLESLSVYGHQHSCPSATASTT